MGTVTSGTLTVTVAPPTTTCSTPATGGTSVSWVDGTAESETVTCYSQGFATANAGNYPTSITLNSGSLPERRERGHVTSSSAGLHHGDLGFGDDRGVRARVQGHRDPGPADNGTYHVTFLATGGANGGHHAVSGTLTVTISQPAPSWETDGSNDGNYFSAIKGVPFCYDIAVTTGTSSGATTGSPASLPLTSLTAGATPAGVTNYSIKNVNLAAGTRRSAAPTTTTRPAHRSTMAPVATNSGGSATDSIPLWSQNECTLDVDGTGEHVGRPCSTPTRTSSRPARSRPSASPSPTAWWAARRKD